MIKVLIVDDSDITCQALSRAISKAPDMTVVGMAGDPYTARDKIANLRPDVVTLDIEMPRMDGLTFLGKLMRYYPLPVIVVSTYTPKGADTVLHAMELGAVDVLEKPGSPHFTGDFGKTLLERIRNAAQVRHFGVRRAAMQARPTPRRDAVAYNPAYKVIAVGASLGGLEAIREFVLGLPANCPGVLIAQHLPSPFTEQFAERLDAVCSLDVRVATSGDQVRPGLVLMAPGDRHLVLRRDSSYCVDVKNGPAIHRHRPSINVLFHSVASCAGPAAVGVLMTGMGSDGAQGLLAMRQAGARTLAQDENSCVVFSMPKSAIDLGAVEKVVSLGRMSFEVMATISQKQDQPTATAVLDYANSSCR